MKKILIIGASTLQLPAIIKAKKLGLYVVVADYDSNAVGKNYADEYYNVSTVDIDGIVNLAKQVKPDGDMTLATDMPMRSVAAATTELGLPGISLETAIKATDKGEMRKTFNENGIESPWFYITRNNKEFENSVNNLTFPCIMKPTDNSGSRGVTIVNKKEDLNNAYMYSKNCSRNGCVIIEEYMSGAEVSVEVIVVDGKTSVLAVTDKLTTGAPHFVEIGHSQQSQLGDENIVKIKDLACRAVKAIGIICGPAHVEIMLTNDGPKIVELGARMGGDCITTHLVPLSTGIDMVKATIELSIGVTPDITPKFNKGSAIRYFYTKSGLIKSIDGVNTVRRNKSIKEIVIDKNVGDQVNKIHSSSDRTGFVIAQDINSEMAIAICENALKTINIEVD